jgi:hypothetical protein
VSVTTDLSDKEIFYKVIQDSLKNNFWYLVGAGIIWGVSHFSWVTGVILFAIYVLLVCISAGWIFLTGLLPSFATIPIAISRRSKDKNALSNEAYLLGALFIRLIEITIGICLSIFLYRLFFSIA